LNSASQSTKAIYTNYVAQLAGGTSASVSFSKGDNAGGWLSIAGFAPPPFGTLASGASVIKDISAGVYFVPYNPPMSP
jgi:hypothetical protein